MANPGSVTPVRYDLAQVAAVNTVISATQFVSSALGVFGDGTFVGYSAWVLAKADGSTNSPKGDSPSLVSGFTGAGGTSATTRGLVTHAGFTQPLSVGDLVLLLHPALANAMFSVDLGPVKNQTDKLHGQLTVSNSVTGNWQTAEQTLVTIGADGTSYKFHLLIVDISALVGNITIRLYHKVNGNKRQIYPVPKTQVFNVASDPPAIPVVNSSLTITEALQVTLQSDNTADNGPAVGYEYKLEAM